MRQILDFVSFGITNRFAIWTVQRPRCRPFVLINKSCHLPHLLEPSFQRRIFRNVLQIIKCIRPFFFRFINERIDKILLRFFWMLRVPSILYQNREHPVVKRSRSAICINDIHHMRQLFRFSIFVPYLPTSHGIMPCCPQIGVKPIELLTKLV